MKKKVWYKWPENYYDKNWQPLYIMAWRVMNVPFLILTFSLFYVVVVVGYGFKEAERVREDVF